jgi:hypothetical protein
MTDDDDQYDELEEVEEEEEEEENCQEGGGGAREINELNYQADNDDETCTEIYNQRAHWGRCGIPQMEDFGEMGDLGIWITGNGRNDVDLKRVRMLDDNSEDWGLPVYYCKGVAQTRGWKFGDWWCDEGHHVYTGRKFCGVCEKRGIVANQPTMETREIQYRYQFQEHNQRVWDAHNGFVEYGDYWGTHRQHDYERGIDRDRQVGENYWVCAEATRVDR